MVVSSQGTGTDVHNLRACDYTTNAVRSNKKYGYGSGNSGNNIIGNWYPGDEWKGDVARIVMYMQLRYPNQCSSISVGEGSISYDVSGEMVDVFLKTEFEGGRHLLRINKIPKQK